ncbi:MULTISPECIES: ATP-binding protein [Gammaproteobacteria]|uniref:ATP-binding protein n=1 Tax=Gammaproteobacteria TaxID=1236 RepID=UPI00191245DE|nr:MULTISPECIES: winged helix-turn-helix domain-containing protein [Gammaproteobacteria]MBK5300717.1 helix-turn-helix transcriptional regulator [Bacillus sp. TH86]MBK5320486.1 helix-turn-helix transcriptional regulator [Bacillus sp. TH59]MBK5335436.1 helix-turn-helix transcriptional regulator [Bacillus sp. TH57]MBK5309523.1 helix-turn-helix transcriptional regulator [Pseudomonas sp. TH71]MBK5314985.1 helix-turn-helix transcriptional regulator [Erwinia sp. TH79]
MNSLRDIKSDAVLRFGPYAFHLRQRLILEVDRPLRMGGRALDILQVLVERAGSVVSKDALIAHVWPTSVVEEINLRVHIAALRRALGDGQNGQRYIVNIPQRGYSFIAPVQRDGTGAPVPVETVHKPLHNLPARLTPVTGRDSIVGSVVRQLPVRRLMTLIGPAGIGKTTVALRVAELLLQHYHDGVWMVDLAAIDDPAQLVEHLSRTLELDVGGGALEQRHALVVLDNCDHLLECCRAVVDNLLASAPRLSILATSREPLRAVGETLLHIPALAVPPASAIYSVAEAMDYSAVQLLVSRARARQQGFALRQQDLKAVREICRRLDGLPLAIELAAAQIDALALVGLQAQLGNCFQLLSQGRRTAVPRHQNLKAALDWSYERLSPLEQIVLQRLAVFKMAFTLDAAIGVISGAMLLPASLVNVVESLANKSLLSVEQGSGVTRYRFLNTTRAYALEKLEHSGYLRAFELRYERYIGRAHWTSVGQVALQLVE